MFLKCIYSNSISYVIVCLTTGYGKSLLYDILPYFNIFSLERSHRLIFIVSPLRTINDSIINRHGKLAYEVTYHLHLFLIYFDFVHYICYKLKGLYAHQSHIRKTVKERMKIICLCA